MSRLIFSLLAIYLVSCAGSSDESPDHGENSEDSIVQIPAFTPIDTNYTTKDLILPDGFAFSIIFQEEYDSVTRADGLKFPAKGYHDLTVFIPDDESPQTKGILYISHESNKPHKDLGDGGGATVFDIELIDGIWEVTSPFHHIDFSSIGFTDRNCGGSLAPNGNVLTCEETWGYDNQYFTKKGVKNRKFDNGLEMWQNIGYVVEVDPRERKVVKRHMTMGKLVHEDVHVTADGMTVYITDDYAPGVFMKMELKEANNFDTGQLYAYKGAADGKSGEWLALPMDTTSLIHCRKIAVEKGASLIIRHEWIQEINGKYYISETGIDNANWAESIAAGGTVPHWNSSRFQTDSVTIDDPYGRILEYDPSTNIMRSYLEGGYFADSSGVFSNPDCNTAVTLNGTTYLVISEDIIGLDRGRVGKEAAENKRAFNEIYFLDMSIENPTVDDLMRFTVAPEGSETTGVIFLPDGSMIINVQHPNRSNPPPFNRSCTVLISGFNQ